MPPEPRNNRALQSTRVKIALTILYIGLVFFVLALIAGVVRAIVKHFKPVPPPTISDSIEFGNPHSVLTSEYPNDDKIPDILKAFGDSDYTLTEVYGPSDQYPL